MFPRIIGLFFFAAVVTLEASFAAPPKLIVVISIDQFRYEYLERFGEHFGPGGFRYLIANGASFANATYKHALNMTGPGHAVILSGSYGNQNGIIANSWYDVVRRRNLYCVADGSVSLVGTSGSGVSPANFIGSTFGDELRVATNFQSKVISLSNKDRAAILMGGRMANAAYWSVDSQFVTSTYYARSLPDWVITFNRSRVINSYFGKTWERTLRPDAYLMMDVDDPPYEGSGSGLGRTFPHPITGDNRSAITRSYYTALLTSPFGSEVLAAFAKAAIRGEKLGQRGVTDVLCIGFSANDYVGHAFGPNSHEVLDMTVQTDRILIDLFRFIDMEVGLKHSILVLTSDHGVAPIPEYLLAKHEHAEAGRLMEKDLMGRCVSVLTRNFGAADSSVSWIETIIGNNVYFNRDVIRQKRLSIETIARTLADSLKVMREIGAAFTHEEMMNLVPGSLLEWRMKHSFHRQRSGDIFYALKPYFIEGYSSTGTTHGEPYDYDAHVPLIIVGEGIRAGHHFTEASPADIGPTLSALTGMMFPAGREGRVLTEALK